MSERPRLNADCILDALLAEDIQFVLIGGLAAQVHGSSSLTLDVDICYGLDRRNLTKLARALEGMTAIRRDLPLGVSAPVDERDLRGGDVFSMRTQFGDLDLLAHPDPGLDYEQLISRAIEAELLGYRVMVASLSDLMAMKRATGRPKDRIELEILGALREELDRRD
jgi:hypothetical protein